MVYSNLVVFHCSCKDAETSRKVFEDIDQRAAREGSIITCLLVGTVALTSRKDITNVRVA